MSVLFVPSPFLAKSFFFFFFCFLIKVTVLPFFYGIYFFNTLCPMILEKKLFDVFSFLSLGCHGK